MTSIPAADAFVSHASQHAAIAKELTVALNKEGLKVWIDDANVEYGSPLRKNLRQAVLGSRCTVLLWGKAARESRWVMMEVLTAYHSNRFIVPCVFDDTPLPQFLQNVSFLAYARDRDSIGEKLSRAIRQAPSSANVVPQNLSSKTEQVSELELNVASAQQAELDSLGRRDFERAAQIHKTVEDVLTAAEQLYPLESSILNLCGYHYKNAYRENHWSAIQAGRAPADPLLGKAERYFFD